MRTFVISAALALCTAGLAGPFATADAATSPMNADELTTATPIKHVVVVFQENASFDHYFGTYPNAANPEGDPPFVAREETPIVNNLLPSALNGNRDLLATNPNQSKPFRLDRSQFVTCSQDHAYKPEQRAANGGLMNRFVQSTNKEGKACVDALPRPVPSPQVMGFFDGNTVTALWNYAQHFALNDNSFATNYGPSTPGALNLVAGRTSGASPDNSSTVTGGVLYGDADPVHDVCSDPAKGQASLTGPNVGDLLTQAGISWGWFQGGFRLTPADDPENACEGTTTNLAGIDETNYEPHHNPFQYFASTANADHLPPSSDSEIGHDGPANHLYDLEDFWRAADQGNLPAVSYLKAAGYQDGHPGPQNSNPLNEQDFLVSTLNHLQRLPEWSSTAVVLAWDDSDGEYDHQFPPNVHRSGNATLDGLYGTTSTTLCLAPSGEQVPGPPVTRVEMRCGYGERLPFLIVSPYAKDNRVDHTLIDQTSVLRFIEDNWSLGRLGHASFDAEAGSLLNMFDFGHHRDDTLVLNHFTGNPNRAPEIESLSITPDKPLTDDTLTVTPSVSDLDVDPTNANRRDEVTLSYEWFDGAIRLPETGSSLDLSVPGNGDRGDIVTVNVTADDGLDTTTSSSSVVIGDTAPAITLSDNYATVAYSDTLTPIDITTVDSDADVLTVDAVGLPDALGVSLKTDGGWEIAGTDQAAAGDYLGFVRASDGTLTSEAPLRIEVVPEHAQVGYTGDLLFSTGSATATMAPVSLRAHVTQEQDGSLGDLTRAGVLFDLFAPGNSTSIPDATYAASPAPGGDAVVDVGSLRTGTWMVVVRTDPSAGYFEAPASDIVPLTVYAPVAGRFVTGGGWVHDPGYLDRPVPIAADDQGTFGLDARLRKDGLPTGDVTYVFAGADGNQYVVRSTGWQGGGLAIVDNHATIAGTCDVTVLDPAGNVVSESAGNSFRLDVSDAPRSDTFALSVRTPEGTLYHRVGTPVEPLRLGGGQVVVHR
jgi:phospholipase C